MNTINSQVNEGGAILPDHPLYAEKLDDSFTHRDSPIVKAAYDLAVASHKHQYRAQKTGIDNSFSYITHPVMLCKLLQIIDKQLPEEYRRKAGLTSEMSLAVALLHDVLEDDAKYKKNPEQLRKDLLDKMVEHVVRKRSDTALDDAQFKTKKEAYLQKHEDLADINYIVGSIYKDCLALKNPHHSDMLMGKRAYQVEHMQRMSPRASAIKMLDQTASSMEDLLFDNGRSTQQTNAFLYKALNVVKAGAENGSNAHRFIEQLFFQVAQKQAEINNANPQEAKDIRAAINIDEMVHEASKARVSSLQCKAERFLAHFDGADFSPIDTILHPGVGDIKAKRAATPSGVKWPDYGIVAIKLQMNDADKKQVVGFSLRVPISVKENVETVAKTELAGMVQKYVMAAIESDPEKQVSFGEIHPEHGSLVQDFWLEKPMDQRKFKELMEQAEKGFLAHVGTCLQEESENSQSQTIFEQASQRRAPIFSNALQEAVKKHIKQNPSKAIALN
jgi:hypothetical protein